VYQSVPAVSTLEPEGLRLRDTTPRTGGIRLIHTSTVCRDIDQAAKYIGAGAATVGVAGSGMIADVIIQISIGVFTVLYFICTFSL